MHLDRHIFKKIINNSFTWSFYFFSCIDMIYHRSVCVYLCIVFWNFLWYFIYILYMYINVNVSTRKYMQNSKYICVFVREPSAQCVACTCNIPNSIITMLPHFFIFATWPNLTYNIYLLNIYSDNFFVFVVIHLSTCFQQRFF